MTITAASVREVMPRTISNTSATRKPLASACTVAAWMTSPSITGSEYGMPISMMSTPFSASATAASMLVGTSGKPAGK